jgi:hypothetical protein
VGDRYPMGHCNMDMFLGSPDRPLISHPTVCTIKSHSGETRTTEEMMHHVGNKLEEYGTRTLSMRVCRSGMAGTLRRVLKATR